MIREAEDRDEEQLSKLYRMLVPNSKKMEVQKEQLRKIRNDPMNFIFVYEEHGVLLGSLTLNICMQALHGERPYAIVENVIVHEDHRGKSIGQSLFRMTVKSAKALKNICNHPVVRGYRHKME
jgi:N-acetylglutamate synthase-like GNAT family acetyltransferase